MSDLGQLREATELFLFNTYLKLLYYLTKQSFLFLFVKLHFLLSISSLNDDLFAEQYKRAKKNLILKNSENIPTGKLVIFIIQRDSTFIFLSIEPLFVEIGSLVRLLSLIKEVKLA